MTGLLRTRAALKVGVILAATALFTLTATRVLAAAVYDHSNPAPSAVLNGSPGRIDIWTLRPTVADETLTQIAVTDQNYNHYELPPTIVDPADHRHFWVAVKQDMPPGRYLVWFKTQGEQDFDRDGGQFAFYVGVQPTKADLAADKRLALTTVDNGAEGAITGVERGVIEGGIPAFIMAGAALWYWRSRHDRHDDDIIPLDDRIDSTHR